MHGFDGFVALVESRPIQDSRKSAHIPGTRILEELQTSAPTLKPQTRRPVLLIVANRRKTIVAGQIATSH